VFLVMELRTLHVISKLSTTEMCFLLLVLYDRVSVYNLSLTLNSICSPDWPQIHNASV
jgi:hypothetical protein